MQKWESAARSQKHGRGEVDASCRESSGLAALQSWSRVPKRAREALKRCSPEVVETLELPILEYMDRVCPGSGATLKSAVLLFPKFGVPIKLCQSHQLHSTTGL